MAGALPSLAHDMAKELAEAKYDKFHRQRLAQRAKAADDADFENLAMRLEQEKKNN